MEMDIKQDRREQTNGRRRNIILVRRYRRILNEMKICIPELVASDSELQLRATAHS